MQHSKPRLTAHRFARYVTWARAVIVWAAAVLLGLVNVRDGRHLRQRGGVLCLNCLASIVRKLIVIRACQLCSGRRARVRRNGRAHDLGRGRPSAIGRVALGSVLRRALRHREPARRIALLLDALAHIDAFAAHCAPRLERQLTRLYPMLTAAPAPEALPALRAHALICADTS